MARTLTDDQGGTKGDDHCVCDRATLLTTGLLLGALAIPAVTTAHAAPVSRGSGSHLQPTLEAGAGLFG